MTKIISGFKPKSAISRNLTAALVVAMMVGGVALPPKLLQAQPVFVEAPQISSFADLIDAVKPAVVSIVVRGRSTAARGQFRDPLFDMLPDDHPLKRFFNERRRRAPDPRGSGRRPLRPMGQGSGFFISEDGYVVTNNHVIRGGSEYTVVLSDGEELQAKLIGADPRTDVAVLKVDATRKFTHVDFADDSKVRIGDWVVAIGNPMGLGGTVTAGVVSARGRDMGASSYNDFIQIDAAINPGNSGGPSFNLNGQVVGINTMIVSPNGGNIGLGFAVPASTAKPVIEQLIKNGKVERGWLGVQIQPVTKDVADSLGLEEAKGAIVADAMEDGPAAKSGIKSGDVILSVNDRPIADSRDLARTIAALPVGEEATLTIWRDGASLDVSVTIAAMSADANAQADNEPATSTSLDAYGLTVTSAEDGNGVVVTDVDPDSDAAEKGIRAGDIIRRVNNGRVTSGADITAAIDEAIKAGRGAVLVQVETGGQTRFVAIAILPTASE